MRTALYPTMIFTLIATLLLAPMLVQAYVSPNPSLSASLLYYSPLPATPGSLVDVYVKVENNGSSSGNVKLTFIDNAPFSLDNPGDSTRSTGTIPSQESFLMKYQVRVSKDAVPGTSYLKIDYGIEGSANVQTALLPIDIQSTTSSMSIDKVELLPATFAPGSTGTIRITAHNNAGLKIASGSLGLDVANIDMAPIGGTNRQQFTDMQVDETRVFEFKLAPSPGIAPGVYKVPLMLSFKDQQNTEYNTTEYIGIPVGVEPELSVYFESTSVSAATKSGDTVIKFVNKGLTKIKFLEFQVLGNDDVKVLSESDMVYVGNIDEDDYQTADLSLEVSKNSVDVPIKVTYRDALNREYEQTYVLKLNAKDVAGKGGMSWTAWLLIIIVVGVVAWWGIRRLRSKRK